MGYEEYSPMYQGIYDEAMTGRHPATGIAGTTETREMNDTDIKLDTIRSQ